MTAPVAGFSISPEFLGIRGATIRGYHFDCRYDHLHIVRSGGVTSGGDEK